MNERLSRSERGRRRVRNRAGENAQPAEIISGDEVLLDLDKLPTRKEKFPSSSVKLTKLFYNSLLYVFIVIMIALLWWGVSDSPWGKSHGL